MGGASVGIEELEKRVGQEVLVSPWIEVTQERIDRFAEATDDRQWIHVDRERARSSPFGGTIAHGFLTLSLLPKLAEQLASLADRKMGINYGLNKLRFTSPVPSGSRIRARFTLARLERLEGAVQLTWGVVVEREGSDRPCLIAEWLVRQYA
ncbi:MAG TPA: MaoC family dehydratase [Anaeromyxobacteraceae bacterium]|nr:MaoC family dehydratase [Anaeromyxobacteraceae bacterium]